MRIVLALKMFVGFVIPAAKDAPLLDGSGGRVCLGVVAVVRSDADVPLVAAGRSEGAVVLVAAERLEAAGRLKTFRPMVPTWLETIEAPLAAFEEQ